jgi:hypothetical protein
MKIWPYIFVVCAICFLACESETQAPACPSELTIDDMILENCLIVQAAAEAFADENDGEYPFERSSETPLGLSLVDFLPDSILLTNPVTVEATEPHYWPCPSTGYLPERGSTCYRGYGRWDTDESVMRCVGYYILGKGLGKAGDIVVTNVPDSVIALQDSLENAVRENCEAVLSAAEAFVFENGGDWPLTLDEETPLGNTLIDFLPGGQYLENPFTHELTEPIHGRAVTPGRTGYNVVQNAHGAGVGCVITVL